MDKSQLIGWASALILLLTLARQVWVQWRSGVTQGVSKWLFIGQCAASTGFVTYSLLERDWVFVVTNALVLTTALIGEVIYLRNRRLRRRASPA